MNLGLETEKRGTSRVVEEGEEGAPEGGGIREEGVQQDGVGRARAGLHDCGREQLDRRHGGHRRGPLLPAQQVQQRARPASPLSLQEGLEGLRLIVVALVATFLIRCLNGAYTASQTAQFENVTIADFCWE